jgi:hypothetical protein
MPVSGEQLSLAYKNPCRVATLADVATLAGGAPSTVDGISLAAGNRVLVKAQTPASENGIYEVETVGGTLFAGAYNFVDSMVLMSSALPIAFSPPVKIPALAIVKASVWSSSTSFDISARVSGVLVDD